MKEGLNSYLKAKYDADNVLRSREEVQEVVKLMRYADVFAVRPQSWQLDRLILKPDLTAPDFVDHCESAYIALLMQKNLKIRPDILALLIFGTTDQQSRVARLTELAQASRSLGVRAEQKARAALGDWACYLRDIPEMVPITEELDVAVLDESPSLARAAELSDMGMSIRTTDFEKARGHFLKAARMMCDLIERGEAGVSLLDLEWYLASYCAASAGAYFFRFEYERAQIYYLAFFALARETEPVWEKVQRLVEPLISFYFTIAANWHHQLLEYTPGRTHPARIAVALYMHSNLAVRQKWLDQVRALRQTNPAILRIVLQRLEYLEQTESLTGARMAREVLASVLAEQA